MGYSITCCHRTYQSHRPGHTSTKYLYYYGIITVRIEITPLCMSHRRPTKIEQVRTVYFFESLRTMGKVGKTQMQHTTPRARNGRVTDATVNYIQITRLILSQFFHTKGSTTATTAAVYPAVEDNGSWYVSTWRNSSTIPHFPFFNKFAMSVIRCTDVRAVSVCRATYNMFKVRGSYRSCGCPHNHRVFTVKSERADAAATTARVFFLFS